MKTKVMMIGIAVAALLLTTENVQAQSRVAQRERTECRVDDPRRINQEDPRRSDVRRRGRDVPPPAPVETHRIRVVDNEVILSLEHEKYDSNRLRMAEMIFNTDGYMTTAQIVRVSNFFDYDSNRIKFLQRAYLNCVDRHNFYMVLSTIQYSSSREKLMDYVMNIEREKELLYEGEMIRKVSGADMTAILKALKNETFDSTRIKLAKMITRGSLLTSRQIADMAKTFKFDSNRQEFLKYAYNNCADPQNYVVAVNTLQYSSSRDNVMRDISRRP